MAKIISKLNLNRTPQFAEDYSLVYARNIKLTKDGAITRDDGVDKLFNMNDFETWISHHNNDASIPQFYKDVAHFILNIRYEGGGDGSNLGSLLELVGIIPDNNGFYAFYNFSTVVENYESLNNKSFILFFNEKAEENEPRISFVNCNWNWSGGDITGNVIKTLRGDIILNVAESPKDNNSEELIPFKSININKSSIEDDESIYTQTPKVPIVNLRYLGKYENIIPNGVYQFFIRFELHEDDYTNWYLCSRELFAGSKKFTKFTSVGSLKYVDTIGNAGESFIFEINKLVDTNLNYKRFQLGFILSTDDKVVAIAWKHFSLEEGLIYFDYNKEDIEEIDITDLTNATFGIYNAKNVTTFKNKQYISNYKETDFNNIELANYANRININILSRQNNQRYGYLETDDSNNFYRTIIGYNLNSYGTELIENVCNELIIESLKEVIGNPIKDNLKDKTFTKGPIDLKYKFVDSDVDSSMPSDAYGTVNEILYNVAIIQEEYNNNIDNYKYGYYDTNRKDYVYDEYDYIKNSDHIWDEQLPDTFLIVRGVDVNNFNNKNYTNNLFVGDDLGGDTTEIIKSNIEYLGKYNFIISFNYNNRIYTINYNAIFSLNSCQTKTEKEDDITTLLPILEYKFYVHYIKDNGEITNGFLVKNNTIKEHDVYGNNNNTVHTRTDGIVSIGKYINEPNIANHYIFYPSFQNIEIPKGYVACFFSIQHYKYKIAEVFGCLDLRTNKSSSNKNDIYRHCIELDSLLLYTDGKLDYIHALDNGIYDTKNKDTAKKAEYFSSVNTNNLVTFGESGCVDIPKFRELVETTGLHDDSYNRSYIYTNYTNSIDDITLIKCTPYINESAFEDFTNMNLLGYICKVTKPLTYFTSERQGSYYVNTGEIYKKNINESVSPVEDRISAGITLTEVNTIQAFESDIITVYSLYNLNYLSLRNTSYPVQNIKRKDNNTFMVLYINSIELSTVYKLESMYKDYTRRYYFPYDSKSLIKFDNTIRASIPFGDEDAIYTFKFRYDDYFNVPTNKGKIINLTSAGKAVLVHTEDSLFVFIGNNTFTGSGQDVTTKETDIFDTGLQEVFGTEKGYGGLRKKSNSIVTENAYVFYDADSKIIYAYSGEEKVINISASIDRLLHDFTIDNEVYKVSDIIFASDFYNDRLFVNIKYTNNKFITLTYSFISKGFISLHDINYDQSFSTKTKCYFTKKDYNHDDHETLFEIVKSNSVYNGIVKQQDIYPELDVTYDNISVIDIILKLNYETIKVLDSISWICSKIIKEFSTDAPNEFNFAEESLDRNYAGNLLEVYTDTSYSGKLNLESKQNDSSIRDLNAYQKPRFNYGIWTLNYFRNIKNIDKNNPQSMGLASSDNNSLIYGKYIVARFIFNRENNFKFENVIFNISNKQ